MAHFLWITCFTILLAVVFAEAWLPAGIGRFRQRLRFRSSNKENVINNNPDDSEAAAEQRRLSLSPWWEDSWSEAFLNSLPLVGSNASNATAVDDDLSHFLSPQKSPSASVLHFCFLQHGHRGLSTDLFYLQRAMQHNAELQKENQQDHDMIVHCAVCNEGKTTDGVKNGGERLVEEILQVIRGELEQREEHEATNPHIQDITISIVGNSLGGLYGRYSIARLVQIAADNENHSELRSLSTNSEDESSCVVLLDGKYRLHFNIFCSTASPHLGISKHTYVKIPRSVELGAAYVLGETGKDLFRLNDLMKTMATCPTYLEPLRRFRRRIAYANAFATDLPVPATTAAFLSDQSKYPHHVVNINSSTAAMQGSEENRHIIATLETPAARHLPEASGATEEETIVDDLVQMSQSLDSLGWTKVFIDLRKEIPLRVALPRSISLRDGIEKGKKRFKKSVSLIQSNFSTPAEEVVDAGEEVIDAGDNGVTTEVVAGDEVDEIQDPQQQLSAIGLLKQKGIVESKELVPVVSRPDDMQLSFPLGHNMMVALNRHGGLYKGGRPVMDSLAKELVQDIFAWDFQEETDAFEETIKKSESMQTT